jgi:hypothetical protein
MRLALSLVVLACAGCSTIEPPTEIVRTPTTDWHAIATQSDRVRLRDWRTTFIDALAAARASSHASEIGREGVLLDPDASLGGSIPDGLYRCRVIKIGAKSAGLLDYVSYPYFRCSIQQQGRLQSFAKLDGSQRQVGTIFPGDPLHDVFLGTLMLGGEARAMEYGVDEQRDVAGFVDRVGPNRWRLVMPSPHFESKLDVMELVPAA